MVSIDMHTDMGSLPGAEYPTAPAIAYGEEATGPLIEALDALADHTVQVTDLTGSYTAMVVGTVVDNPGSGLWALVVRRYPAGDEELTEPDEDETKVLLTELRRVLVY